MTSIGSNGSNSSNWGSSNGSNWSSSNGSNWDVRNSVDWGGMSSYDSLGGVGLVCGVVDVRGLNDLLDGVNLVGSWDWDGTGNGNIIRLGDMLVDNDLTGNGTWDSNRDINVVFLDIDLWNDVGDLGSDSGVSSDWSSNSGLDNSVSRGRSSGNGSRWDGSIRCWCNGDGWRGKGNSVNKVLGSTSDIRSGRLRDGGLSSNSISVSSNNLLDSSLDGSLSNDSVFNTVLNYWGSSSIRGVSLSNNSWSTCNWGSNKTSSITKTSMSYKTMAISDSSISFRHGSTIGKGHKGNGNTKSVHVSAALFRSNSPC